MTDRVTTNRVQLMMRKARGLPSSVIRRMLKCWNAAVSCAGYAPVALPPPLLHVGLDSTKGGSVA